MYWFDLLSPKQNSLNSLAIRQIKVITKPDVSFWNKTVKKERKKKAKIFTVEPA